MMICEHSYTIMINEIVKHSTDDFTFFITLLLNEYSELERKLDAKEFKSFKWTVYTSQCDRIIIHFICLR